MADVRLDITADYGYTTNVGFGIMVGAFADDVEGDTEGWENYAVTPGYLGDWHVATSRNHTPSGQKSWYAAPAGSTHYSNLMDAALETPDLVIPAAGLIRFWHWMEAQTFFGGQARDGGLVEISTDGGAGWTQIEPEGGYPTWINGAAGCPFPDYTPCFGGSFDWTQEEFDLSAYAGVARLRFRFGSDETVTYEGWYIDDLEMGRDLTDVADFQRIGRGVPSHPLLGECSPNPFNPVARIDYAVPERTHVRLEIYDVAGRLVRTLVDETREAGYHQVTWRGADAAGRAVASGIFFYRMTAGDFNCTRKAVLMK